MNFKEIDNLIEQLDQECCSDTFTDASNYLEHYKKLLKQQQKIRKIVNIDNEAIPTEF